MNMYLRKSHVPYLICIVAGIFVVIPFIIHNLQFMSNFDLTDGDTPSFYGFFRLRDPGLFPDDYHLNYYFDSFYIPQGYFALNAFWATFADIEVLHRVLPPLLWLSCIPSVWIAAKRLGGRFNAHITLILYLCSSVFLHRFAGAMPHSFAYVFSWWTVAALLSGHLVSLVVCTLISPFFYPCITPIIGMTLAIWWLFPRYVPKIPERSNGLRWPWFYKCLTLALIAAATIAVVATELIHIQHGHYGRTINAFNDSEAFPETAFRATGWPLSMISWTYRMQHSVLLGIPGGDILTLAVLFVLLLGLYLHDRDQRDKRLRSLAPFVIATGVVTFASKYADPGNAYRYVTYTFPVLITLLFPLFLRDICWKGLPRSKSMAVYLLLILAYAVCIGKPNAEASGYRVVIKPYQKEALRFIATLPNDSLIAGWPGRESGHIAEFVPYFAKRKALVTEGIHHREHEAYTLVMRDRTNALIDAYLARDRAPIIALRDQFHADYLIVNEADFTSPEPPVYFEPFNTRARELWEENTDKPFMALQIAKHNHVYAQDGIYIIDLHRL